jgi:hypothetical protein
MNSPPPPPPHPTHACSLALPPSYVQVTAGWVPGADVGPLISPEAKARVESLIASGLQQVRTPHASLPACLALGCLPCSALGCLPACRYLGCLPFFG